MASVKKYNLSGKEVGEHKLDEQLLKPAANTQMVKDYLVALRANARQWSANTKGRSEVAHSGQKPHPQKGTGRARQGCLAAPQYKGGGRVFGPKPKFDQHVSMNRKEKKAVLCHLLREKMQESKIHILQFESLKTPKTKTVADFLKSRGLEGKRVLFLGEGYFEAQKKSPQEKYENFTRSVRNIPRAEFMLSSHLNGYAITGAHEIFIFESALDEITRLLEGVNS